MSSNCSAPPRRSTATAPTVLYCAHGIQAACPAECMQRAGIEAHCFKGGQRGGLAWGRSRGLAPG